jgi:tetratricopeptide (TPR) repeat protein
MGEESEQHIDILFAIYFYSIESNYLDDLNEPLLLKLTDLAKKALGEEHPDYAASLNNLAELYERMGNYAQAEPLYQEVQ